MSTIAYGSTSQPAPRLRLTARGRAVIMTLVATPLVALALFLGLNAGGAIATGEQGDVAFQSVSVEPGQSLWEVAAQVAPAADPREVIAEIVLLNQLDSAVVQPGQELAIPTKYAD